MKLSKSSYCKCIQCKKQLWLDINKPSVKEEINNDNVLENGTNVGELARNLFGDSKTVKFDLNLSNMIKETNNFLKQSNIVLCEASFSYKDNFCSVDILIKNENKYEIYEVKSSTNINDIYLDDVSYQYYVLTNLGLNINKVYIVHIDNSYVRHGKLELSKLFKLEDVSSIVLEKQDFIKNKIDEINEYMMQDSEPKEELDIKCFKPYNCPYFKYCSRHIPDNNIFDIASMNINKKIEYYKNGRCSFLELIDSDISDKYREQIEFQVYDKDDYVDKDKIKSFLDTLSYPLYFLDFESFQEAVPRFDNVKPYMQIPFQYSLHYYLENGGELYHKEFLSEAGIDPRRSLAEALVRDIPMDVCVLAYNMSFEKGRIHELSDIYPDLREHLLNIESNIKDLMIPFKNRWYYSKNMQGSYSIKYVLPALYPNDPNLDYHNLPVVHNGKEASDTFLSLRGDGSQEEENIRKGMLMYCGLDTYAMVKVYEKLVICIENS